MGIRASFTELTPDYFEQMLAGTEGTGHELRDRPRHSIDKAWNDYHSVFRTMGPPLSLAISGDCLHPQSPHSLEDFYTGDHEWYMGLVSPGLTRRIAEELAKTTSADYKRWESERFGAEYNCGEMFFPDLKSAYLEAASRKNALMILIC